MTAPTRSRILGSMTAAPAGLSAAQYLALEAATGPEDPRHELWDGELRPMAGTSPDHNAAVFEIRSALSRSFRTADSARARRDCRVFSESVRVRLSDTRYAYPDVVAACPPEFRDEPRPPTLLNPELVIEVLSPSTEDYDRGRKLRGYQALDTVRQVVLVSLELKQAELHLRQPDGAWLYRPCAGTIPLADGWPPLDLDALVAASQLS